MTRQKSEELLEQIAVCQSRHKYVADALAESEKIALEITKKAEIRVDKIFANAQRVIVPQQEHIARLEQEIYKLSEEIRCRSGQKAEAKPDPIDVPYRHREFSLHEPQYIDPGLDELLENQNIMPESQMEGTQESLLSEPRKEDITEINNASQSEPDEYNNQSFGLKESSLRKRHEQIITEGKEVSQFEQDDDCRPMSVRGISLREPQEQNIVEVKKIDQPEYGKNNSLPISGREFSMKKINEQIIPQNQGVSQLEQDQIYSGPMSVKEISWTQPQHQGKNEFMKESQPEENQDDLEPITGEESSWRESLEQDITEITELSDPERDQIYFKPMSIREISLREPQEPDLIEIKEESEHELDHNNSGFAASREFSLRIPQNPDIADDLSAQPEKTPVQQQQLNQTEYNLPEIEGEDISNYNLAMSIMEQNESDMHLDVFVDIRYVVPAEEKVGKMQRHSWQVKILVEVPMDSQKFVGYGKVSSAVTSTLLRFDDVVLNDVYPFGIISPNSENIAMFFYNCIEDTVILMDLRLKKITIWENQALVMEVNQRNTAFDDKLQKGDDILHDIRSLLVARGQYEDKTNSRGRFGHLFKNI